MTTIISKRHPIKFYFLLLFMTMLANGLGVFILFYYQDLKDTGQFEPNNKLMPLFSLAFFVLAAYTWFQYFKNAPIINIDNNFIRFNDKIFPITDIQEIIFTGKHPFKFALSFPMEGAKLTLKNGQTKYIFDDIYSNSGQIKLYIEQVVIEKKDFFITKQLQIDASAVDNDFYDTYKGNQITSLRGVILWGFLGLFGYTIMNNKLPNSIGVIFFLIAFSAFWIIVHSYMMHYFKISDNFLVIKNHNFFWKKKVFHISEIKEVVFETYARSPNYIRIITKDFRSKYYPAATLKDNTWLRLKDKLETYQIKVRNECI